MEDRLTQCLNEIIYSDDCPGSLRDILASVIELGECAYSRDASDFEEYIQSDEFVDDVYSLFGVDLF